MGKSATRACVAACLINLTSLNLKSGDVIGATLIGLLFAIAIVMEILRWANHRLKEKLDEHEQ